MCSYKILAVFFLFVVKAAISQSTLTIGNTVVPVDTLYTGLDVPWEIEYGTDSHIWLTERKGLISRIDPVLKTKTQILDITSKVFAYAESGLLGFAFHPDFPATPEIFTAYNYGSLQGMWERIVKYTYQGGQLGNEIILIDSIKGGAGHNGARFLFLPDKTLLVTLGEAQTVSLAQNMNSLNGKIIRLNTNGTVPSDNPISNSFIYSWGHRNPQGLAFGPAGNIYTSEHGATTSDEFQLLEKNRNYGWPDVEGACDDPQEITFCQQHNVKEPIKEWTPTLAVGDLTWYSNPMFPELDNRMLMTTLKDKSLVAIQIDAAGLNYQSEKIYLKNMFGRLRAVCVGPSREIYLATNGANSANIDPGTHSIIRLRPPAPPIALPGGHHSDLVKVNPNPARERLYISSPEEISNWTVRDLHGVPVIKGNTPFVNIAELSSAAYIIEVITSSKQVHRKKFIKL